MENTIKFLEDNLQKYEALLPNTPVKRLVGKAIAIFKEGTVLLEDCVTEDYRGYLEEHHPLFFEEEQ